MRIERGFTLDALAPRANTSARQLQRLEAGEVDPRLGALAALAGALSVTVVDLVVGELRTPPAAPSRRPTTLGRRVRALRDARHLSLGQLALRSGVSVQYLQRVETGRQSPTVRVLTAVAEALGLSLGALFSGL
ncbi:MAG: helix-turn-helix transcriptional regulator [Myxococcales bacterium]|nr:helix-turn-helix transcriptional regulator [Myxococcales bacterium]